MSALGTTRRTFLKSAGATSIAVVVFGVNGATSAAAAPLAMDAPQRRFALDYDDSVRVTVTSGRRFDVIVADRDGTVLERHRQLTLNRLFRVRSNRFVVSPVEDDTAG